MARLELWLYVSALAGLSLGILGVAWARSSRHAPRSSLGRLLFVGTLLVLGAGCVLAAFHRADGLVPLGLSASFLVVAMFLDSPRPVGTNLSVLSPVEEL